MKIRGHAGTGAAEALELLDREHLCDLTVLVIFFSQYSQSLFLRYLYFSSED